MLKASIENVKIGDDVVYENQFGVTYDCKVKQITDTEIILDNNAVLNHKGVLIKVTPRTLVFKV